MLEQTEAVMAVLRDGGQMAIRPAEAGDEMALAALEEAALRDASPRDRSGGGNRSPRSAARETRAPRLSGHCLTAWANEELVGAASYRALGSPREAEAVVAVAEKWRARGVGTLLLEHLVSHARERGVGRFHAEIPADNTEMLTMLAGLTAEPAARAAGDPRISIRRRGGSVVLDVPLRYDERYLDAIAARESQADAASLLPLFAPTSVAVIGASRREASVGNAVVRHLVAARLRGLVYPVNPHAIRIAGRTAYPSVSALPQIPDLAVVAVPAPAVAAVAAECGRCGVKGLVVLSAGLSAEDAGRVRRTVRRYGMRIVGPNCIGIANTDPTVGLDATFTKRIARPGPVGVLTQSGGIGFAIVEALRGVGLGVSTFASVGNKYDVSGNDMLLWWRHDGRTKVAIVYLESFGNPRKFARLARGLTARMPLVVVRAGSSKVAQQAARSHTAATATPAVLRDELLRRAGAVATDDLDEAIDAAAFFARQPLPRGHRVALVCNTGGAGVLAADACAQYGLEVPPLSAATQQTLAAMLPPAGGAVINPVDTSAGISAGLFGQVLAAVAADPGIDAIIPIVTPTAVTPVERVLDALPAEVPVAAVLLGQPETLTLHGGVPVYASATAAVRALGHAADYAATRLREPGTVPEFADVDTTTAEAAIDGFLAAHPQGGWLDGPAAETVARCYGLPVAPSRVVSSAEEAAAALTGLGGRVAMKALVPGLVHRTEEHAVILGIQTADEARAAHRRLADTYGERLSGVLVQQMLPPGTEMLAGFTQDAHFGPLIQVGAGGVTTDLLKDRSARLLPLTDRDARDMIGSLRMAPLLSGFRGAQPLDVTALTGALHRIARLASDLPAVTELDINPLILYPDGCAAADVKIRAFPARAVDPYLRRLP